MTDDRTKSGGPDRTRINVNEDYELQYWSEKWQVSQDHLRKAVASVGPMVKDVAAVFGKDV
jgi:hypothetical protein